MTFETENKNFQSQLNYEIKIHRMPHVTFNVNRVELPGIDASAAVFPTRLNSVPFPGDELTYSPLNVEFKIQEGMRDWYEVFQWMHNLNFPQSPKQYSDLLRGRRKTLSNEVEPLQNTNPNPYLQNIYSQITILIHTSKNNPYLEINFYKAFPITLSAVSFNSTDTSVNHVSAAARFAYAYYDVKLP